VKGQCAFVRAAYGKATAAVMMNEWHPVNGQRPTGSLAHEDRMHPGEGSA
jgi:hypothetical protein